MREGAPRNMVELQPDERIVKKSDTVISRRSLFKGVAGGAAVLAVVGLVGRNRIQSDVRDQFLEKGDLTPELREELETANLFVLETQGWTVDGMREFSRDISDFKFPLLEGEPNFENVFSNYNWLAVREEGLYLPSDGNKTVGDLARAVTSVNNTVRRINNGVKFESGQVIDYLEAEAAYNIHTKGGTLFDQGHVVTGTQFEVDDVPHRIAIGRVALGEPISYITFDASDRTAPLPAGVSAGGLVVSSL